MSTVLIPIPDVDFDPTEVGVSWSVLSNSGHQIKFATESGIAGRADEIMLSGRGLDPWGWMPGLRRAVMVGRVLRADKHGRAAYAQMEQSAEFRNPSSWNAIDLAEIDGLLLPGGHRARGMRAYLESDRLKEIVVEAFGRKMQVGAICHGVLLAARSTDPETGHSVLYGHKTTALTWHLEHLAANIGRAVRFWDPSYYRTYPDGPGQHAGYMSVQSEVTRALKESDDFVDVDPSDLLAQIKNDGRHRDSLDDERPALVVEDGNYTSARWPGDVHTFAKRFAKRLHTFREQPTE
jgi:putative intracellular protease/amidase